jgi:hypothetical protein
MASLNELKRVFSDCRLCCCYSAYTMKNGIFLRWFQLVAWCLGILLGPRHYPCNSSLALKLRNWLSARSSFREPGRSTGFAYNSAPLLNHMLWAQSLKSLNIIISQHHVTLSSFREWIVKRNTYKAHIEYPNIPQYWQTYKNWNFFSF